MKNLPLFWYRIYEGKGNFGDELGYYIVSKLSGLNVERVLIPSEGLDYIFRSLDALYKKKLSLSDVPQLVRQFFLSEYYATAGSILSMVKGKNVKIWGSGVIKTDAEVDVKHVYAVRGEITKKRLGELGIDAPEIYGDPALLLPVLFQSDSQKDTDLGLIPHYTHGQLFQRFFANPTKLSSPSDFAPKKTGISTNLIELLGSIEPTIRAITRCEATVSTSLHGLIVSHAYGIPSLWVKIAGNDLYGDDCKFYDYFSSVDITPYEPLTLSDKMLQSVHNKEDLAHFFLNEMNQRAGTLLPQKKLSEIQVNLLKSAPFYVQKRWTDSLLSTSVPPPLVSG